MVLHVARLVPLLVLTACSSPTAPEPVGGAAAPPASSSAIAQAVVEATNAERTREGKPGLTVHARLAQAAQLHADQLVAAGRLDHVLSGATYPRPEDRLAAAGYAWQAWGENLASGQRTAQQAVDAWMASAGHRDNILNDRFTEIGVAVAADDGGRLYYVQVFGRPR